MKWAIGITVVFVFFYFISPLLFRAMVKHDYDTMYYGLQDAKRNAGAFVQEQEKPFVSYAEDYAYGRKTR